MAQAQAHRYHDQTKPEWTAGNYSLFGTGLVLYDNTDRLESMQDITYQDFSKWAEKTNPVAIKWVPGDVMSLEQMRVTKCRNLPCVSSCLQPGCICNLQDKICVGL